MAEDGDQHAAQGADAPGKRPPWRKQLWGWMEFGEKTGWQWLELLGALAVPVVLTVAGFWLTDLQDARQREIENRRAEGAALQAYLDQMGRLLLEEELRDSEAGSDPRLLARARTLTVLAQLHASPGEGESRKEQAVEFLIEAELVQGVDGEEPVISLEETELRGLDLDDEDLRGANLKSARLLDADLSGADLRDADLTMARVGGADLSGADLRDATMPDGSVHP